MSTKTKPAGSRKGGTESTRHFSYKSFSKKIASLKIDPVRRVRRYVDDEETTESFFKAALEKWVELNLSTTFTLFTREITPLCESLPIILHNQDKIFEELYTYIDKRDALALEPLLDLLAQLAHDLGANFERYLERSVTLLSSIVAKHVDVQTIEWTFNCLAYLLKYLSRLLVPDLRPLYDVLAPLLGRENQKSFVIRFAAEALSFLVRKAKGDSLRLIVRHVFEDLQKNHGRPEASAHSLGLMTTFHEACVGVDRTVHSKGPQVFRAMLDLTLELPVAEGACLGVVQGVLTGLIHHTMAETFKPILEVLLEFTRGELLEAPADSRKIKMAATSLYTCVSVRKGHRIKDWSAIGDVVQRVVEAAHAVPLDDEKLRGATWETLKCVAVVLQTAEIDVVISKCSRAVEKAKDFQDGALFLPFCEFVAGLGQERFVTFVLPYLQRFMLSRWAPCERELCLLIPRLASDGALQLVNGIESPANPTNLESPITIGSLQAFTRLESLLRRATVVWGQVELAAVISWRYLDVISALISSDGRSPSDFFHEPLLSLLSAISTGGELRLAAVAGKALSLISRAKPTKQQGTAVTGAKLHNLILNFGQNATFLQGALEYFQRLGVDMFDAREKASVRDSLVLRLTSPNSDTRYRSLCLLQLLSEKESDVIRTAKLVAEIPLTVSNQRNIAMYVRKMGIEYSQLGEDSIDRRIVPYYCFGLMTVRFSPLWEEASKTLALVVESNDEVVTELAFNWLAGQGFDDDEEPPGPIPPPMTLTPFECSNLKSIEQTAEKCVADGFSAKAELDILFTEDAKTPKISVARARGQALYVLCEIPKVAEKRSRLLVPMFLEWSLHSSEEGADDDEDTPEASTSLKWSRKDQLAMLTVFSKFVNPKVLYKSDQVYASLLKLLASGDAKVQAVALKSVLTWKAPAIKTYTDQLTNILDDVKFRDELTNFVRVDEDESLIQPGHREGLMPVLLRLLYGRSLSRRKASSGKKGMSSTRTAVLAALASFRQEERSMFIDIALGEVAEVKFVDKSDPGKFRFDSKALGSVHFSLRKQVGLVRMFEDLLKQLGTTLLPHLSKMLDALLYCLVHSENIKVQEKDSGEDPTILKALKAVRQGGFKCLNFMFHYCPTFTWTPYLHAIFDALVNPRLEKLPAETSQSVSSLLQLFSTWTGSKHTITFIAEYNDRILRQIAECLGTESAKDEVVLFIVQLVRRIVSHADNTEELEVASSVKSQLLRPNIDLFLNKLGGILRKSIGKDVLEQCIECVAALAPHVVGNTETTKLVDISIFLLDQPSRRVSPKAKSEILKVLVNFVPLCVMEKGDGLYERTFNTVSSLFGFFKDRESRNTLAVVLQVFADRDPELKEVAELSRKLNAFSTKRLEEPDFEQRLEAYGIINEERYGQFNAKQWLPLLYNMLFFVRDTEELAIRTNASYAMRRFAEVCGAKIGKEDEGSFVKPLSEILLPALRNGAREPSEIIRVEYVGVMAHVTKECPSLDGVGDMTPLLVGGDEEANFFNNILHIQQHRRGKAMRRLVELVKKYKVHSSNVSHFLLPLIEHFVFDQAEGEHNLANEAVITIGALSEQLEWSQYRAVFRRFMGYIKSKPDLEKIVIRLIGTAVSALSNASEAKSNSVALAPDADGDVEMIEEGVRSNCRLAEALPEQQKLARAISNEFLPTMSEYLHQREESTVALRVPVAVSMVKLLRIVPEEMMRTKLPGVLTDVCHILRSRAQDDRDMTRKTLAEIALLLGPEYFSFILKELRGALLRGYQLHVLSFTVHSILVTVVPTYPSGSLDYCVNSLVDIVMDDIFGVTGSEKDAEGYISKMKEVKGSKSYDSMDILATITTLPFLGNLVRPIRALLQESLNGKMVKKIDELLRRITTGLLQNEVVKDRNLLVFCYEIVQDVYKAQSTKVKTEGIPETKKRYLVNLKVPSKNPAAVATSSHVFKLIKFALDILRTIVGKHDDLMTPENMAGFVPIMGDAVLSNQEEVQISALRLFTTIIRVPLPEIDEGAGVFLSKALSFIKSSPSTNAEIAQASLKLMSAILRERKSVAVKETTIAYILTRIKPDLEEPDRQGVTFNFLKSVMIRKIVIPEVYDIVDQVAAIMVTNQTRSVRDLSRSLYFQFLMDYPQGQGRLKKQLAFLVKNLDYVHESGRKSVLDAIHLLITKIGDDRAQEVLGIFFVPLVMVLVNDDSTDCREMTGVLLKEVFTRADSEHQQTFHRLLRAWVDQDQQQLLIRVSLQVYGLYFDVVGIKGKKELSILTPRLNELLSSAIDYEAEAPTEWELVYFSLQLWSKLVQLFPETVLASGSADIWSVIRNCLRFPHTWIRLTSSRLLGLLFSEYARSSLAEVPLVNSRGLRLEAADLLDVARFTSSQLNSPELTDELGLQVVKNLLFLARCFYASSLPAPRRDSAGGVGSEDAAEQQDMAITTALDWIISRISGIIRNARNAKKGLGAEAVATSTAKNKGKKYALQLLAAVIQVVKFEDLVPLAERLILPLFNLVELPDASETKDLKQSAQEILSLLQGKIGTTEYARAYTRVKGVVMERRQERRSKRRIEAVAEPEVAARRKTRKHERKREVRKEKGREMRDYRRGKAL